MFNMTLRYPFLGRCNQVTVLFYVFNVLLYVNFQVTKVSAIVNIFVSFKDNLEIL